MNSFKKYAEYLKNNPEGYWFKRKAYGWGWTPAKWQGWLIMLAFVVFIVWSATTLGSNSTPNKAELDQFFIKIILAVAVLIVICYRTGEKPKWQWGITETDGSTPRGRGFMLLALLAVIIGFVFARFYVIQENKISPTNYKDATYTIENWPTTLVDGVSKQPTTPGSASITETRYFGNEATGDLNGDGQSDVVFLLTQNSGGSGTFYYVVAALKTSTGYHGTNAILLGDRIAPQTTEIRNGEIIVNYADRQRTEPMTIQPSVGVSKYLKVSGSELVEIKK